MNHTFRARALYFATLSLLLVVASSCAADKLESDPQLALQARAATPAPLATAVTSDLALISRHLGADKKLEVLGQRVSELPASARKLKTFKVRDRDAGTVHLVTVDESGNRVSLGDAEATEAQKHRAAYGAMSPKFHARVAAASPTEQMRVLVQYREESEAYALVDKDDVAGKSRLIDQRKRQEGLVRDRVTKTFGPKSGHDAKIDEQYGPFVALTLPVKALRTLIHNDDIAFIGAYDSKDSPDFCPGVWENPEEFFISSAKSATDADLVAPAYNGAGVRIGVLEGGRPYPAASCYNLVAHQNPGTTFDGGHVSGSLSVISSRAYVVGSQAYCNAPTFSGMAPGAQIILANGGATEDNYNHYVSRYAYAEYWGANVISMSWHGANEETSGNLDARDVFFDYVVSHGNRPSVFTSAGNQGMPEYAFASGKGYNFFGVGVANFQPDVGDRCDYESSIHFASSSINPVTGLDIPEITAPAHNYFLPHLVDPEFGCTSAATPTVASIAALMMSKDSNLKFLPEAVRAIMLATADFQDAELGPWNGSLDTHDGAGMINANLATQVAGNRYNSGGLVPNRGYANGIFANNRFPSNVFDKKWTINATTPNKRMRVAVTWNSRAPYANGTDSLDSDFDLVVIAPNGLEVWSGSIASNYEIADFSVIQSGNYRIEIRQYGPLPVNYASYFSLAWSVFDEPC